MKDKKPWYQTLPAILGAIAALITALTGAYIAIRGSTNSPVTARQEVDVPAPQPTNSPATARQEVDVPVPQPTAGWYGFLNSVNLDREAELRDRCSETFTRVHVTSGMTFEALCSSIGMTCAQVCDWEGNPKPCSDSSSYVTGDGSRIAYCQ